MLQGSVAQTGAVLIAVEVSGLSTRRADSAERSFAAENGIDRPAERHQLDVHYSIDPTRARVSCTSPKRSEAPSIPSALLLRHFSPPVLPQRRSKVQQQPSHNLLQMPDLQLAHQPISQLGSRCPNAPATKLTSNKAGPPAAAPPRSSFSLAATWALRCIASVAKSRRYSAERCRAGGETASETRLSAGFSREAESKQEDVPRVLGCWVSLKISFTSSCRRRGRGRRMRCELPARGSCTRLARERRTFLKAGVSVSSSAPAMLRHRRAGGRGRTARRVAKDEARGSCS